MKEVTMFEKEAEEYLKAQCQKRKEEFVIRMPDVYIADIPRAYKDGAESTLRKIIKYFSTIVLDEYCGGYFSYLLENEEKMQELAKELENV